MSILTVNKRKFGDENENYALPRNDFNIKESNTRISIRQVLRDHPETRDFSGELTVSDNINPDDIILDFGSVDLSVDEENITILIVESFRDKNTFTSLEQINIDSFGNGNIEGTITASLEIIEDGFNEDTITEIDLVDICGIRDSIQLIYQNNTWDSFSVGEKRILIADWLIPSYGEIQSVFQSPTKRSQIFKLFAVKMISYQKIQSFNDLALLRESFENEEFNLFFKRIFAPGKISLKAPVFISRSNIDSADANGQDVNIPVFSNIRTDASFIEVVDNETGRILETGEYDVSYSVSSPAANQRVWQVGVEVNLSDIDGQGMKRDARQLNTISHIPIRVSLNEGDIINLKLRAVNNNNSSLVASSGKSIIRIEKVIK